MGTGQAWYDIDFEHVTVPQPLEVPVPSRFLCVRRWWLCLEMWWGEGVCGQASGLMTLVVLPQVLAFAEQSPLKSAVKVTVQSFMLAARC
jgi:hypothetical protein